jgi:hypothetical protein
MLFWGNWLIYFSGVLTVFHSVLAIFNTSVLPLLVLFFLWRIWLNTRK